MYEILWKLRNIILYCIVIKRLKGKTLFRVMREINKFDKTKISVRTMPAY